MDVPMRLLRYFVAVAEELHVTRAARRLYLAQPALSKAITRLERELGVTLFVRNRHGVALTDSGRSLLPVARRILAEFDTWLHVQRAAQDAQSRTLHVGYHSSIPTELLDAIMEGFHRRRPDWRVELRLGDWSDPAGGVLDGRMRAALLPLPVPGQDRLDTQTLRRDRRFVALPADHPLTTRTSLVLADLQDQPFVALPTASGPLREFWLAIEDFDRPPSIGTEVDNSEDYFQAILAGHGVAMLTESSARAYQRPGIEYRPVEDATPGELSVVWASGSTDPLLRDFVRACTDAADRDPQTPTRPDPGLQIEC